jgi:hypothetical protein
MLNTIVIEEQSLVLKFQDFVFMKVTALRIVQEEEPVETLHVIAGRDSEEQIVLKRLNEY